MCGPTRQPPAGGYGYGPGWRNPTRTRTLLYPADVPGRVEQPVTIPRWKYAGLGVATNGNACTDLSTKAKKGRAQAQRT